MSSTTKENGSLWLSAGVFVVVAVASQVVQRRFLTNKQQENDPNNSVDDNDLGRRYSMKKMTPSLSDLVALERKEKTFQESGDIVYDFEPKNSNWSHFDREEEEENNNKEDDGDDGSCSSDDEFLWTNNSIARGSIRSKRRANSLLHHSSSSSNNSNSSRSSWLSKLKESHHVLVRSFGLSTVQDDDSDNGESDNDDDTLQDAIEPDGWKRVQRPSPRRPPRRQSSAPLPFSAYNPRESYEPQVQNRVARRRYNARIMPNKVVLIRHGQSMGNINEDLYSTTPDNAMPLTKLGWEQARHAGQVLREQVLPPGESVHFIVSPYVRTVETFHGVVSAWCDPSSFSYIQDRDKRLKAWYQRLLELGLTWHEDPRIREQDFGNYQDPESIKKFKRERNRFGSFFYRFPHGESASDVFDRVSTFLDSLWRSFYLNKSRNYVLITHGISIRVLLARYFRYTIAQFQMLANPKNCEMVILKHDGAGRLQLEGRCEQTVSEDKDGEMHVTGSTFHERLRVVPSQYVPKAKIRISYDD